MVALNQARIPGNSNQAASTPTPPAPSHAHGGLGPNATPSEVSQFLKDSHMTMAQYLNPKESAAFKKLTGGSELNYLKFDSYQSLMFGSMKSVYVYQGTTLVKTIPINVGILSTNDPSLATILSNLRHGAVKWAFPRNM